MIKGKRKKRQKVAKTMNSGTMTPAQFWQMIRHVLRKRTMFWLPIIQRKNDARVPYKGPNKKRKYSYICEGCGKEFSAKQVNVHHTIPAGELNKPEDLPGFVTRLFCEKDKLKLLCEKCHDKEHET